MFTEARKSYSRKIPSDTLYVFNIVQAQKERNLLHPKQSWSHIVGDKP